MNAVITSIFNRNCGIGQYTEHLAKSLAGKVESIKTFRKDHGDNQLFINYPYRSFKSLQHHVAPYYLKQAIQKEEADIWHADHISSFLGVKWASKKRPIVVTAHDAIPFFFGKGLDFEIYKYQLRQSIKGADYIIVVSETAKEDLVAKTGISSGKVVAIPNGINSEAYDPSLKSSENEKFIIRYLGGVGVKHKNVASLLHMAKILEDKGYDFSLEIAGYMPEKFFLRDIAKSLNLKAVKFSGFIADEDKASFLAQADLFVFPSLMEGFGFPPMEAMASGTPVLASDIRVFEELLGGYAVLSEPSPRAFALEVESLIASKDRREYFSGKGLERVKQFTWDITAQKTIEVYDSCLKPQMV